MDEKEFDSINVIPLVDIMLVLLTIVLITATFISIRALPVKLPETHYTKESPTNLGIELTLNKNGQIIYQDKILTPHDLENLLQGLSENTPIVINIDENLPVKNLVSLLDLFKKYHLQKISIKTIHKPNG